LDAGVDEVEPLSPELPPQPAIAAATAIAATAAQTLILRSIVSSSDRLTPAIGRPCSGYGRRIGRVQSTKKTRELARLQTPELIAFLSATAL